MIRGWTNRNAGCMVTARVVQRVCGIQERFHEYAGGGGAVHSGTSCGRYVWAAKYARESGNQEDQGGAIWEAVGWEGQGLDERDCDCRSEERRVGKERRS